MLFTPMIMMAIPKKPRKRQTIERKGRERSLSGANDEEQKQELEVEQMLLMIMITFHNLQIYMSCLVSLLNRRLIFPLKLCSRLTYTVPVLYCIVFSFSNMDYKRHPFTLRLYDT